MLKKSRFPYQLTAVIIMVITLCAVFFVGCGSQSSSQSASSTLVNGRQITPAGMTSGSIGNMPLNIVLSPDGRYAVTTSSCVHANLSAIRVSDGAVVSSLTFQAAEPSVPNGGLFYGLAFDPTPHNDKYILYAAQGAYGTVATVTLAKDGTLAQTGTIPAKPVPYMPVDQPAGIAFANGTIFMANYFSVDLKAAVQPASTLSMYRASDGARLGSYTFMDEAKTNTPSFPYAVVARSDGTRAYVVSQRDGCVYVLNTANPANIVVSAKVPNLSQPSALLLNKAQTVLYVANAESDTISVIDVSNDQARVKATVLLRPSDVVNLPGVSPSGLALSPDEKTLYASLGDFNAAGVIDMRTDKVKGYIPVGWYPTALTAAAVANRCWSSTDGEPGQRIQTLNSTISILTWWLSIQTQSPRRGWPALVRAMYWVPFPATSRG